MRKTYQYRLYPNKVQESILLNSFEECRWLYNHLLEQRKIKWEENKISLGFYEQKKYITQLKKERDSLNFIHSQVLQNIAMRIELAFQSFFRRLKAKNGASGYPRFKGKDQYDSITYPQSGFELNGNHLKLSKIGKVKIRLHRQLEGTIKTLTIKKDSVGHFYACFSVEIEEKKILPKTNNIVGVDVGLESFATYSDGTKIKNPCFLRKSENKLKALQSKYSKNKSKKIRKQLSRLHNKVANSRKDFCHKLSRNIVNNYDIICIEDLSINRMIKERQFSKSIQDAAWNTFVQNLLYKAEEAGRIIEQVNPAYTSQDCSSCGYRVTKKLSERIYNCPQCGLSIDRDVNAALNILRLGTSHDSFVISQ